VYQYVGLATTEEGMVYNTPIPLPLPAVREEVVTPDRFAVVAGWAFIVGGVAALAFTAWKVWAAYF
jgi:hypothetical protein